MRCSPDKWLPKVAVKSAEEQNKYTRVGSFNLVFLTSLMIIYSLFQHGIKLLSAKKKNPQRRDVM